MRKEYVITGLDCGHCALTLEKYLQKVDGVKDCNINFSTGRLFIEIDDVKSKEILKNVFRTTKQVNPDVKLSENNINSSNIKLYDIIMYIIGLILGLIVIFLPLDNILFYSLLTLSILCMGYKTYYKAIIQLRHFRINENTLITISIIGAIAVGESMEGLIVIALYTLGKFLESRAVNYSRRSISALITTQPEYAVVLKDNVEVKVKPDVVSIGDIILVRPGEKVPLDGVVIEGSASVDRSHLTGESEPINYVVGDSIESGSIILDSTVTIRVTHEYRDSAVSKILSLVTDASSKKSRTESFIAKFSTWYTLGVIVASIITFGLTLLILGNISTAIYRGLIFLVVSCPCAFAISVPLSYFSGIGRCSKQGILIKGSNYLDICARLDRLVFDKTGTLTSGKFVVTKVETKGKITESELMQIAVAGERNSLHPVAKAICEYAKIESNLKIKKYKEIAGTGIEFEISKDKYLVGRTKSTSGETIVAIKKNCKLIGKIYLKDEIKEDSIRAIKTLQLMNIKSTMLTGDNKKVAKSVAKSLGITECKYEMLPEDKYKYLEDLKKENCKVGYVGDGINDAPALTIADVGISMGIMGSPASIESSDVVIADDNIERIPNMIKISKFTRKIVWQNIIFAGITKLSFLVLGALGITGMLLAVFADVGVTLLAILNSLRVLSYKTKEKM